MEHKSIEVSNGKPKDRTRNESESTNAEVSVEDASNAVPSSPVNDVQDQAVAWKGGGIDDETLQNVESSGEVNTDASVNAEDVIRAGGFGARDDISSLLPVASDWTDFEASIRDARNYEEPQGDARRPGLGWTEASERE